MKEPIDITEYAGVITEALPRGILLNTRGDKFNTMVIGWGHLGTLWGKSTFCVYVRRSRFTREALDKTGEFTVSIPVGKTDPVIDRVCSTRSGHDTDKEKEAKLLLEAPETVSVPGIRQYPLTLECKVLYAQEQDIGRIPADIIARHYPPSADKPDGDPHTMYVGEITAAYIIRD